jgi:hypothetical protein
MPSPRPTSTDVGEEPRAGPHRPHGARVPPWGPWSFVPGGDGRAGWIGEIHPYLTPRIAPDANLIVAAVSVIGGSGVLGSGPDPTIRTGGDRAVGASLATRLGRVYPQATCLILLPVLGSVVKAKTLTRAAWDRHHGRVFGGPLLSER